MTEIKILVMADGNSIHTEKWIQGLSLYQNFDIYLLTMNPAGVREAIGENPKVHGIYEVYASDVVREANNYWYLKNILKIRKIVKELKPDVISTIYLTSYGLIGSLFKGNAILNHFMIGSDIMVTPDRNFVYNALTKYSLSKGDLFVSSSRTMAKRLLELSSIPDDRLLTQQYGVSSQIIDYPQQEKEYDFVSNRAWFANSNIPFILEIISHLNASLRFALIGDKGPLEKEIKERFLQLPNVRHLGLLPYMENIKAVAQSKFYISLTSSDGASLSLMEAMAVGAVPIVSGIEPNLEWVEDGVNGFIIDLSDRDGAFKKFKEIADIPEAILEQMRVKNRSIINERGNFEKNMSRFNDSIIKLVKGRKKRT